MPVFPNFVGGSYTSRSFSVANDRTINLYAEQIESQTGKNVAALYGCPGLQAAIVLPTGPIRAITVGNNRLYVVSGSHYYLVDFSGTTYTYTDRGSIGAGTGPAQVVLNGTQAMIIAGGYVFIDTGTALIQPLLVPAQGYCNTVDLGDGYGYASVQLVSLTDQFDTSMVGGPILIGDPGTLIGTTTAVEYEVGSFVDPWNIKLTTPAGPKTNAPYWIPQGGTVATHGTAVSYNSGDVFVAAMNGQQILINELPYTVTSVDPPYHMTVTPAPPEHVTDRVPYAVSLPLLASCGTCLDGYFIIATPASKEFHISAINNGLHWDPLDVGVKQAYTDNIAMLLADHQELYIFGTTLGVEVWRDTGAADFPFERDLGAIIQMSGCIAPWSVVSLAFGVAWLGSDPHGKVIAYRAQGFQPVRVSTHAVESAWSTYSTVADAEAFVYSIDGHETWQLTFPTAGKTWCWDAKTQLWYEKQYSTGFRHRARFGGQCWERCYVGDYGDGTIYRMGNDIYNDNGTAITCVRRCPHLSQEEKRLFFSSFRLDMEKATGLSATLAWSNNGAATFITPIPPSGELVSNGTPGNTIGQEWRRLGSGRDRVFELQLSASSRIAISQAFLNTQSS